MLGSRVAQRLRAAGHALSLLVRSEKDGWGSEFAVGDMLRPMSLGPWLRDCEVVLHLATALRAGPSGEVDWARNDLVRSVGTANLLDASARAGVRHVVVQSVAFVRSSAPGLWCVGDEPLADLPVLQSLVTLEALTRASGLQASILRGGLFYGTGTSLDQRWRECARGGSWPVPANETDYVSLVHVDDMAAAVTAAVNAGAAGTVAIVDDTPVHWGTLIRGLASLCRGTLTRGPASSMPSFRVSNRVARQRLRWSPEHKSWQEGICASWKGISLRRAGES